MLSAQRQTFLIERLNIEGRLVARELALELDVSEDTLRRDLRDLAAAGLCQRVYGGALPLSPAVADYAARQHVAIDSKQRVAAAAAALLTPGITAILDGGTTALLTARALPHDLRATVITHSPTVAVALIDHRYVDVYLIGGRLFKHSAVACGATAVEAASGVNADLFLLGVTGVHATAGLTTDDAEEAAMKRALARRAAETYVLASREKIGTASRFTVLPLGEVAGIICDSDRRDATMQELSNAGVNVIHG